MRHKAFFIISVTLLVVLFVADISVGSVRLPFAEVFAALTGGECDAMSRAIVLDIRLIKAVVAVLAGAALSVSGLQMQTLFRNPLAGPYVLGISSGASLGAAAFILGLPFLTMPRWLDAVGMAGAAWIGSAAVLAIISAASHRIRDIMVILVLGMMFSSGVSALVQIMQYLSSDEALKSFVIWTMGSLSDVTRPQLAILLPVIFIGLVISVATIKPLNLLLFGEEYARSMGIDVKRTRLLLFLSTTLLAGTITAFCGPIGFIGLAMPHVTRMLINDSNHRSLIPATILSGGIIMLVCDLISKIFTLPINAITALLGIPVVVMVVIKNSKI